MNNLNMMLACLIQYIHINILRCEYLNNLLTVFPCIPAFRIPNPPNPMGAFLIPRLSNVDFELGNAHHLQIL